MTSQSFLPREKIPIAQHEKRHLCHMRTAKTQMNVRIRAVLSGHSLFVDICSSHFSFSLRRRKKYSTLILFRVCGSHGLHVIFVSIDIVNFESFLDWKR